MICKLEKETHHNLQIVTYHFITKYIEYQMHVYFMILVSPFALSKLSIIKFDTPFQRLIEEYVKCQKKTNIMYQYVSIRMTPPA